MKETNKHRAAILRGLRNRDKSGAEEGAQYEMVSYYLKLQSVSYFTKSLSFKIQALAGHCPRLVQYHDSPHKVNNKVLQG